MLINYYLIKLPTLRKHKNILFICLHQHAVYAHQGRLGAHAGIIGHEVGTRAVWKHAEMDEKLIDDF